MLALNNQTLFSGGQLKRFIHVWQELTSDTQILQIVSSCRIEFQGFPKQQLWATKREKRFSKVETLAIDKEMKDLLR